MLAANGDGGCAIGPASLSCLNLSLEEEKLTWNHRVIKRESGDEYWYAIHEVYYDDNKQIETLTEEPVYPVGESIDDLRAELQWMLEALDNPVLNYETCVRQAKAS